ncbi:hypothetical protein H0V99_02435 [Candidatus Saccharibacteria bacterium]|nr:hypothetical protein [Candidatus Saccharibacteria bacterium]
MCEIENTPSASNFIVAPLTDPFALYRQEEQDGRTIYSAGFPSYPANFSRDTFLAGIIAGRSDILSSQLEYSAAYQGKVKDPVTGESPGRIHHEQPGAQLVGREGLYTTYNACDTTSLFLIACEHLADLDRFASDKFMASKRNSIESAVEHIQEQLDEDKFYRECPPVGSDMYSLRVTYWKDSILPNKNSKLEPIYPVTYPLAHFIAARGLLSASRMLNKRSIATIASEMFANGIRNFIRPGGYMVYEDAEERVWQESSDELHSLAYIPVRYNKLLPKTDILRRSEILKTAIGYMCTPSEVAIHLSDGYHGDVVWVFEQALIYYGATKFDMGRIATVAAQVAPYIGEGQELFKVIETEVGNIEIIPKGNNCQLWSVAAATYFAGRSALAKRSLL